MIHEEDETMLIAGLDQEEMAFSNDEHHKLSLHLIDHLAKELFELQGIKRLYDEEAIATWLVGSPLFNNIVVTMEQLVSSHKFHLKGLEFRPWDETDQPLWLDVLFKLKNIYFEDCVFHCPKLALNHTATWYEGCKFSPPWFVTMGKNPEGLVERGDSLYNACEFSKGVSLYGDDVDEETLGLYGIVFQDCKMASLYVNSMSLAARLYVAPVEPADVFRPDRHGTPKALESFQVTSTVFKKAFDLSRLHFGEIQFSGCTFEEGVDLSGLVCDRLGLDSCNVNGRFSLDHAHTKKVGFKDCHFKRSVILDAGTYQALLFNASSFEQVLSLEFAEIADCIGIGSCSMSKPPNFLNCQLSGQVIEYSDRETFRIIKNSFDAVGNQIEANRYFSYEMNAYLKELRLNPQGRVGERWLIELNKWVSDHGQNYWKPLVLILILPIVYGVVLLGHQEQWLYGLDPMVDLVLGRLSHWANLYASYFGLGITKPADGVAFISLLFGLVLSGLIWHFLVAVRRHRRR